MLKTLGLLRESGEPTSAYHEYLDPSRSGVILAEGLRDAYADLFQINKNAQNMTHADVRAKFKTISQGAYSDDVLGKMASTFLGFAKHADFESPSASANTSIFDTTESEDATAAASRRQPGLTDGPPRATRLVYELNIHLPATRDPAVYDALFSSLSKHLDI